MYLLRIQKSNGGWGWRLGAGCWELVAKQPVLADSVTADRRRSTLNPLNSQKKPRHMLSVFCGFCVVRCVGGSWFTEYGPLARFSFASSADLQVRRVGQA